MANRKPASAPTPKIGFKSNRDVAIHVPDLDQAAEFYGNVLGFKPINRSGSQLAFDTGTFRLWINKGKPLSYVPSYTVADFEAAREYLESHGCTPVGRGAPSYFKDPFGFVFDIIEGG